MIDDRGTRAQRAVSPSAPLSLPNDRESACTHLQRLATGGPDMPPYFYHRYLHAHTTVARLLIPQTGVRGLRHLYKLAISLALLAGIGFAMLELARGRNLALNGAWLILFATFARWFGLESYGQSVSHAPADLVILAYLLFLSRGSAERPLSRTAALAGTALFGALTIEFEFLTGGLPLGLAVIIGALPLALAPDKRMGATVIDAVLAFAGAVVVCIVAKLALVAAIFGTAPLGQATGQFLFRAGLSHVSTRDQPASWGDFFSRTWAGLDSLAPGMQWLVVGMLGIMIVAGIWGYARLRDSSDAAERQRALALLASNIVLPLWMVILWQHTAEHAWYMDRILVWPIASGGALFLLAILAARRPGADQGAG